MYPLTQDVNFMILRIKDIAIFPMIFSIQIAVCVCQVSFTNEAVAHN